MKLADELLKIEELRNRGTLNDSEFQQAKATLLNSQAQPNDHDNQNITKQIAELQQQAKLAAIDRDWEIERQRYLINSKYGTEIPTRDSALLGVVLSIICSAVALMICISSWDSQGRTSAAVFLIPLIPIVAGFAFSMHVLRRAKEYEKAHQTYQLRRKTVTGGTTS